MAASVSGHLLWLASTDQLWCGDPDTGEWQRVDPWPNDRTHTGRHADFDGTVERIRRDHPNSKVECRCRFTAMEADGAGGIYAAFMRRYLIDGSRQHEYGEWQSPGLVHCEPEGTGEARGAGTARAGGSEEAPAGPGKWRAREVFFDPLWDEDLDDIVVARSGEVWLAGSCAVRLNLKDGWFACYSGLYECAIHCVAETPEGNILFGTQHGVRVLDPYAPERSERETRHPVGPESASQRSLGDVYEATEILGDTDELPWVTRIAVSPDGTVWGAMLGDGLLMTDGKESLRIPLFLTEDRWRGDPVTFDATRTAASEIRPGAWAEEGLKPCTIRDIHCDGRGRVWVASDGGLAVWDGDSWHAYGGSIGGIETGGVLAVALTGDGPDTLPAP